MEDFSKLRYDTLTHIPGFARSAKMFDTLNEYFAAVEQYRLGTETAKLSLQNELVAFCFTSQFYHRFYGTVVSQVIYDFKPEASREAIPLIIKQLRELEKTSTPQLLEIYPIHQELIPALPKCWKKVATCYGGWYPEILRALKQSSIEEIIATHELEFKVLDTVDQAMQVFALKHQCFHRTPSLCWFWKYPGYQQNEKTRLINSLSLGSSFGLYQKGQLVGYVGLQVDRQSDYWKQFSGIDVILNPILQNKGLSKLLYYQAANYLKSIDCEMYRGATANPAVSYMANNLFKRWPIYFQFLRSP